ncbi:MAG: amidohydrolase [Chitinophagaceae bacterium]|nr:amidohydrolase [Chitinophagaceae bacterium]
MKALLIFPLVLSLFSCNSQQKSSTNAVETVFQSVNIIPMDKERVIENQDVVVRDGRIIALGNSGKVAFGKDAFIINGKGKYLIPGLAEMHAHVPPVDDIEPMKNVLLLFAVNGITTIRGMLGHPRHLELRSKIQSGEILGPHFYTSGPSFNGNSVKSPEAAEAMVVEQKNAGYDFFKLHPGLSKENFAAIEKKAKELHMRFAGHVSYDVGVWRAIDAGYASIDHLDGFVECLVPGVENIKEQDRGLFGLFIAKKADTAKIPALMKALHDHAIWVVPTQALAERWFTPLKTAEAFSKDPEMIYMNEKTLNNWINNKNGLTKSAGYDSASVIALIKLRRKLIYECQKNNVGILSGSDAPQVFDVPGFSLHQELKYMVDAGLTPFEALTTSTVNVASYFNLADAGTIKTGNLSDLVLLNGNPLTDISQTTNIEGVMLGKKWLAKEFIDTTLKQLQGKIIQ